MSYRDTTAKLQDRVLDLVTGNQDKVLDVVNTVVEKAEPVTSKLPRRSVPEQVPSASHVIDNTFGFGDRLLTSQKSFAHKLVDVGSLNLDGDFLTCRGKCSFMYLAQRGCRSAFAFQHAKYLLDGFP